MNAETERFEQVYILLYIGLYPANGDKSNEDSQINRRKKKQSFELEQEITILFDSILYVWKHNFRQGATLHIPDLVPSFSLRVSGFHCRDINKSIAKVQEYHSI